MTASTLPRFYRLPDLVAAGIVNNKTTLARWIKQRGFPSPIKIGVNTAVYPAAEVDRWLEARAAERPPVREVA